MLTSNLVEKLFDGSQSIGAGELLLPGEVILSAGESYSAPALISVFSGQGLDGIASSYHQHLRSRELHPKRPRPLTLNMWEAVYFDHNEEKIKALIDVASEIGIERVVLDDGWFHSIPA